MSAAAHFVLIALLLFASGGAEAEPNPSKKMIPDYRDEWRFVEVRPKGSAEIWMFRKNLGVAALRGLEYLPTLVYFTVQYVPKDEAGLPNDADAKVLYDFEEEVVPKVEELAHCVHVGSVVKGGVKDHLFYVSDVELFLKTFNEHRKALSAFKVSLEKHDDPKWEAYVDFPGD